MVKDTFPYSELFKGGTPKSLDEAIAQAIDNTPTPKLKEVLYHVIRDFLAQKFAPPIFSKKESEQKLLKDLFDLIVAREKVK